MSHISPLNFLANFTFIDFFDKILLFGERKLAKFDPFLKGPKCTFKHTCHFKKTFPKMKLPRTKIDETIFLENPKNDVL